MRHLDKNVLDHLAAVVVHADVTGEGLAEENVSESHTGMERYNLQLYLTTILGEKTLANYLNCHLFSYPKFWGSVSISPSIKFSAPLIVDGSSLMS